jgi:ribosome assembly protein YihI (activator of Der GTPase)
MLIIVGRRKDEKQTHGNACSSQVSMGHPKNTHISLKNKDLRFGSHICHFSLQMV